MSIGCDGPARRESEQLLTAVERFRRADNASKPGVVVAIRSSPCSAPEVCAAREACLSAAEATGNALALKSEVEQGLAALEKGALAKDSPEAQALPGKLDVAEALLKQGHEGLGPCEERLDALRRRYRL
jgi:hypothetical protein